MSKFNDFLVKHLGLIVLICFLAAAISLTISASNFIELSREVCEEKGMKFVTGLNGNNEVTCEEVNEFGEILGERRFEVKGK